MTVPPPNRAPRRCPWLPAILLAALGACSRPATPPPADRALLVDGSSTLGPLAKGFAERCMADHPGVHIAVSESGSGNGVKSLINGTCHVAALSRFLTPAEMQAAVNRGIRPAFHVVAMDALAVVVHPANPLSELSVTQVRDIFTGRVTNWREVGGPDHRIVRIGRAPTSGTTQTFKALALKGDTLAADTTIVASAAAVHDAVAAAPGAIGFIGLAFADARVKTLALDGVRPDAASIADGTYALARPLMFVTNGYPPLGSPLHAYVTLHLTPVGQRIVSAAGFVPATQYPDTTAQPGADTQPSAGSDGL